MPIKQAIVNASPLITLFNSQLDNLLPQLFNVVEVPPAVWQEVTAHKTDIAAQSLPNTPWAKQTAPVSVAASIAAWDLGAGESAVLSYALTHPSHTAIIDDAAARRCAISLNIPTLGTGGLIVLAKRRGIIPSVMEPIESLRSAGLWLSDRLVTLLKQQAENKQTV